MRAHGRLVTHWPLAGLTLLALLAVACGSGAVEDRDDEPLPIRTATSAPAASTPTPSGDASADDDLIPPLTATEFCEGAELTIVDFDTPDRLTDQLATGTISLRYRLPPGAEALSIWIGVDVDIDVTIGKLIEVHPNLARIFPGADPGTPFPATIPSGGFELEQDGVQRTIQIAITLPTEQAFDGSEPWRWSSISSPPFRIRAPRLIANFRASGTRVRMDGRYCTPIILPLP